MFLGEIMSSRVWYVFFAWKDVLFFLGKYLSNDGKRHLTLLQQVKVFLKATTNTTVSLSLMELSPS
jgi:hypothetical protein